MSKPTRTIVFCFEHNIDAVTAADALVNAILRKNDPAYAALKVALNPAEPDVTLRDTIARELSKLSGDDNTTSSESGEIIADVCVLGYCPDDLVTLDILCCHPVTLNYFLYENNIQFGAILQKELVKRNYAHRASVCKPSAFRALDEMGCGNSICDVLHSLMVTTGSELTYSAGCRAALSSVGRWFTGWRTHMSDLDMAWALRFDHAAHHHVFDSECSHGLTETLAINGYASKTNAARKKALTDALDNTHAIRTMNVQESKKLRNTEYRFKTFMVSAEHTHDVCRRVKGPVIIVSRVCHSNMGGEGYLVTLVVDDTSKRAKVMRELGVERFWMEGDKSVGFSARNPLV